MASNKNNMNNNNHVATLKLINRYVAHALRVIKNDDDKRKERERLHALDFSSLLTEVMEWSEKNPSQGRGRKATNYLIYQTWETQRLQGRKPVKVPKFFAVQNDKKHREAFEASFLGKEIFEKTKIRVPMNQQMDFFRALGDVEIYRTEDELENIEE